jgi:hypothetical protein
MAHPSLLQLPGELLQRIVQFALDVDSLCSMASLCRASREATQFYAHRLMARPPADARELPQGTPAVNPPPHGAGMLYQQFACDVYSRAEVQKMNYIKFHQGELRAEIHQGLVDAVNSPDFDPNSTDVGRRVILPSTYPGSPRAMQQNYLDALAIVSKYGKPDFFITMTASPTWPEILGELHPPQTVAGRPDLVARVFHLKFKQLLDELLQKHVLGIVVGYTWVIEFQKRGLPHAHILLMLPDLLHPNFIVGTESFGQIWSRNVVLRDVQLADNVHFLGTHPAVVRYCRRRGWLPH